jgi:hypothetical protein
MSWRRGILAACAAAAIAPTAAVAQPIFVSAGGGPLVKQTSIPVRITGLLSVQFHGDPAAGCARWGLCGYSGTVSWQPPPTASLQIERTLGRHPNLAVLLFPNLTGGPQVGGGVTSASVTLADGPSSGPASRCIDATDAGQGASLGVRHGHVTVSLARESPLLVTRCAGPRDADVLSDLPTPTLPVAMLERGRRQISLAVSHPLKAHGFVGSITSTIVLHLGRPGRPRTENNTASAGKTKPGREIDVTYRASLSGSVVEEIRGAANPLECGPVGSCGLTGTITLAPHVTASARLTVDASAATPYREALAAAGLGPGSPGGVTGLGIVEWSGGGSVTSDLSQGPEHCHDTALVGPGGLLIRTGHGRWSVDMFSGGLIGGPGTSTRCPGPTLTTSTIASNAAPLSSFARPTTRIALTSGSTVGDDGYRVRIVPYLTLTLTRLRVRTKAIRIETGLFGGF